MMVKIIGYESTFDALDFEFRSSWKINNIFYSFELLQLLANQWNRSWGDVSSSSLQSNFYF